MKSWIFFEEAHYHKLYANLHFPLAGIILGKITLTSILYTNITYSINQKDRKGNEDDFINAFKTKNPFFKRAVGGNFSIMKTTENYRKQQKFKAMSVNAHWREGSGTISRMNSQV
jgi:hypothetical protein